LIRFGRKHRLALLLLSAYLFFLLFPMLFLGRILSPNDVYYQFDPWASHRYTEAQNPLIYDPPVSYYPLISLLREDPSSFHWNRYVASGIPGFGSAAAAVLTPLIAVPALLLPLAYVYVGIIVLKFVAGFALAYWWLREERLGRRGAAVGSLLFSAAGPYMVWWLWQSTNASVLYPAALLLIARAFHRKKNSIALMTILVIALLLSGFPAAIAYLMYLSLVYIIYLAIRYRTIPLAEMGKGMVAFLLGVMISAPFLAPLITFLHRSGYFSFRQRAGYDYHYPLQHLLSFVDPFRLGDPSVHLWLGDPRLAISNNFVEATVYVGLGALLLVPLGILARRAEHRWFWLSVLILLLVCMFGGHHAFSDAIGELPGIRYSPLTRLRILLPLPVAYLSAAAVAGLMRLVWLRGRRAAGWGRELIAAAIGLLAVIDLARVAARFYPYIDPALTRFPESPTVEYLRQQPGPFRVAPFFNYLIPNSAELVRLEDIRSHFGSEQRYRNLLRRFDPEGFGGSGSVILFNSLKANLADPVLSMCNVRFLVEPLGIDVVRWRVLEKSAVNARPVGEYRLRSGQEISRQIPMDGDDHYAIDLDLMVGRKSGRGSVLVELIRPETGKVIVRRSWTAEWLQSHPKNYLPIWPHARDGNALLLRIRARNIDVSIPTTADGQAPSLLYGKVRSPVIPLTEFSDGRLFENLLALPRYWAVWNARQLSEAELLSVPMDFSREAILGQAASDELRNLAKVAPWRRRVDFRVLRYSGSYQAIETSSEVPFLLATSEKLTPELQFRLDGEKIKPLQINGLFAGVRVRPGRHRIELTRRIGRGWWVPSFAALLICLAIPNFGRLRRRRVQRDAE
jgi:hypothetical protein